MGCNDNYKSKNRTNCIQASRPKVDNSELECDDFISSKCVYIKDIDLSVEDNPYPTLNDYILHLEKENYLLRRSNANLKQEVASLNNKFNKFVSRFDIIERRVSNIKMRNV